MWRLPVAENLILGVWGNRQRQHLLPLRWAMVGLVTLSTLLAGCKSYVTIAGRFDEYAEGGLLRVRTPDTKHLPCVSLSNGWYEQFVEPSIVPDSTGAFSQRVRHRGFGAVYAGEYNRDHRCYVWPGDSVYIHSPSSNSVSWHFDNPRSAALKDIGDRHREVRVDSLRAQVLRGLARYDSSQVDSARFARVLLDVKRAHRAQYDSLLRAAAIPSGIRKALCRKEEYFGSGISVMRDTLASLYPALGVVEWDVLSPLYRPARRTTRHDRRLGLADSYKRYAFTRSRRYERALPERRRVWWFAKGSPYMRGKAARNQQTLITGWTFQMSELDTAEWDALMRLRHRHFGGTLLDSLVQEAWAARRLALRWGMPAKKEFRRPLCQLDSLWLDTADRRPILLWAWVVGDPAGQRDLAKRIAVEREVSRLGVRIVYLSFNERDFNLRLDLWSMGLWGEYFSAAGQARRDLLRLFGVREYRRSRFALLSHGGKLLDGALPLPQEGEAFLGRIRALLARREGALVEE